jgi:hypothetical protein
MQPLTNWERNFRRSAPTCYSVPNSYCASSNQSANSKSGRRGWRENEASAYFRNQGRASGIHRPARRALSRPDWRDYREDGEFRRSGCRDLTDTEADAAKVYPQQFAPRTKGEKNTPLGQLRLDDLWYCSTSRRLRKRRPTPAGRWDRYRHLPRLRPAPRRRLKSRLPYRPAWEGARPRRPRLQGRRSPRRQPRLLRFRRRQPYVSRVSRSPAVRRPTTRLSQ